VVEAACERSSPRGPQVTTWHRKYRGLGSGSEALSREKGVKHERVRNPSRLAARRRKKKKVWRGRAGRARLVR
jgi:hypothetical protein